PAVGDRVTEGRHERVVVRASMLSEQVRQHDVRKRASNFMRYRPQFFTRSRLAATIWGVKLRLHRVGVDDVNGSCALCQSVRKTISDLDVPVFDLCIGVTAVDASEVNYGVDPVKSPCENVPARELLTTEHDRIDT